MKSYYFIFLIHRFFIYPISIVFIVIFSHSTPSPIPIRTFLSFIYSHSLYPNFLTTIFFVSLPPYSIFITILLNSYSIPSIYLHSLISISSFQSLSLKLHFFIRNFHYSSLNLISIFQFY